MSAAEIIELIKKLPPQERAEVEAFVLGEKPEMRVEEAAAQTTVRHMPREEAERIAEGVFQRHSELFRKLAQ